MQPHVSEMEIHRGYPPITIGSIPIRRQIGPPGAVPIIWVVSTTSKSLHSWNICPLRCHLHSYPTPNKSFSAPQFPPEDP
jgi:hypothetical protein